MKLWRTSWFMSSWSIRLKIVEGTPEKTKCTLYCVIKTQIRKIKCNKNTRKINRGEKQSCSPQVVSRNRHHQAFIRYWDVVSRRGGWISWISPICLISWCVPSLPTGVPWLYISNLIVCDGIQFPARHLKDPLLSSVCVCVCARPEFVGTAGICWKARTSSGVQEKQLLSKDEKCKNKHSALGSKGSICLVII